MIAPVVAVLVVMVAAWPERPLRPARRRLPAQLPPDHRPGPPRSPAVTVALSGLGAAAVAWVAAPAAAVLVLAVTGGCLIGVGERRRRALGATDDAVIAGMEALAAALRSGASLPLAVAEAAESTPAPIGPDLAAVAHRAAATGDLEGALRAWSDHRRRPSVQLAAAALGLGLATGGANARAVDGIAATLRQRRAAVDEGRALAAQARLSAVVMTAAPVAFGLIGVTGGAGVARFLLGSRAGLICLAGGLGLDLVGAAWMSRLAGGVV